MPMIVRDEAQPVLQQVARREFEDQRHHGRHHVGLARRPAVSIEASPARRCTDQSRAERNQTQCRGCDPGEHQRAVSTIMPLAKANNATPSKAYCSQTTNA